MSRSLARAFGVAAIVVAATALSAGLATAQLGDPQGPGQSVAAPPPQCPRTVGCTYSERNSLGPNPGYRFQALQVCGANCTTQYWVTNAADGRVLLSIEPMRGGGIVAMARGTSPDDPHPGIRVIEPGYAPTDAMRCPSFYKDTTYVWDAARSTVVPGSEMAFPSGAFPGWEAVRAMLEREGWTELFRGL
jgi:hypothetical protein